MLVLVCNAGSTSLKFKLFNMPSDRILAEGKVERIGRRDAIFTYTNHDNGLCEKHSPIDVPDYTSGISLFLNRLLNRESGCMDDISELDAVGFKTVLAKGFSGIYELTDNVIHGMEEYVTVAPAHNPPYIQAIEVFRKLLPGKLLVGCFETAFHKTIPLSRRLYALPYEWYEKYGIQRYGYHGASHSYIARKIQAAAGNSFKLISCHMGGSGSICAIENGKSVDTSFGFSLQTGIPHANRCGDMDAYIIPYLLGQGMSLEEIMLGIDKHGGLLGLSGVSNDLREIEAAAQSGNERAALAIEAMCDSVIKYIGAFYAELGGLDYLVFTGGIGENSSLVREKVCTRLAHLGISLDTEKNRTASCECEISKPYSKVKVLVIPANEEVGIAQAVYDNYGTMSSVGNSNITDS